MDALAKLFMLLVKYYPQKVNILHRILTAVSYIIDRDYKSKPRDFNQRPFCRLYTSLLSEFAIPAPLGTPVFESYFIHILSEFYATFHAFRPTCYPGFAFAWLELVSHRLFMPKLLKDQASWEKMHQLITDLFEFLEPYLRKVKLLEPIRVLYKGTLRVLLILLHDFPEFLCDYHFSFCDVIPSNCIQLRNLILSAFPKTMELPDPFTPNLKVDLLPEIKDAPNIKSRYMAALINSHLLNRLEPFLKSAEPSSFLTSIIPTLYLNENETQTKGTTYNVPMINSLVLTLGARGAEPAPEFSPKAPMEIFRHLAVNLDPEGRYHLFNAIANQLRYPNNHTHYFSCVLLFLFVEAQQEVIQEQITRVLVERLMVVQKPHPWGLLITFIELVKNPRYHFWSRDFTRYNAPEIERLFEQIQRKIINRTDS